MLYVTHRLDEVFRIADRVTVLRDGRVTMTGPIGAVTFGGLVESIAGRSIDAFFPVLDPAGEEPVLEVEGVRVGEYGPVSFELRRRVLALVGLRGGGTTRSAAGSSGRRRSAPGPCGKAERVPGA
jgi:ABC-type sugar transport system ATPase subunit